MSKGKYKHKREHAHQHAKQETPQARLSESEVVRPDKKASPKATDPKRQGEEESLVHLSERVKRYGITDWLLAIFTLALVATSIYQMIIVGGQLDVMRADQRAWVKFEQIKDAGEQVTSQFTIGQPLSLPVRFVNTGKTPATRVHVKVFMSLINVGAEPPLEDVKPGDLPWYASLSGESGVIFPNSDIKNVVTRTNKDGGPFPMTEAEFNAILGGTSYLFVWGTATYDDIFQAHHWTKFCYWVGSNSNNQKNERCSKYDSVDLN
jgi:hypothetical protein